MAGSGSLKRRSPGGTSLVRTLAAGLLAAASLTAARASALPPGAASTTDWAQFRFSAQHSGLNPYEQTLDPSNVAQLTTQWSFTTGGSVDSSPAVVDAVVYVGSFDHYVYAIDAATGAERWRFPTGDIVDSSPAVVGGVVYVGSFDGNVYAIDAATGTERWSFSTGDLVDSSPAVADVVVYVGSFDGRIYAIDALTGSMLWSFITRGRVRSSPAVDNGVVYVGSLDNRLYALDGLTGSLLWTVELGGDVYSSPAVSDNRVYVGSADHRIYALDPLTGAVDWTFLTGGVIRSSPAVAGGLVYAGSDDRHVYSVNASTGELAWATAMRARVRSSPAVANGVVYLGSADDRVYALDAASGAVLWRGMTGKNVRGSPSVVDGAVYVGSDDHALYAYGLGAGGPASGRTRPSPLPAGQPSADFNGDGYQDVAVGTIFENIGSSFLNAGAVNVVYGSAAGLQATGTGGPDDQFWYQGENGMLGQPHTGNHFGFCTQPGDFNADGYDDLAIGIELQQIGDQPNAGAVEVLYGSPTGLQATGTGGPDDQLWSQDSPGVQDQSETGDGFGRALASADFNGDGYADLAIGVKGERPGGPGIDAATGGMGIAQVLFGGPNGLQADSPDDQLWSQDSPGVKDRAEDGDLFGRSLGAGDFNADGYGDLAIGAYDEKVGKPRIREAGAFNVLYGGPNGLQADSPDDQFWYQGENGLSDMAEVGDEFGRAITSGDFNADGFDDLAVSARREDVGDIKGAGSVSVLYGSPTGLEADGVGAPDDQFWTQDSDGVEDQCEEGDWFGMTVVAADFNADGYADLAIGARFEDVGAATDAGSVNVLYGSSTGLQADGVGGPDDQFWTQDSVGVQDQAEPGDRYGQSIAAADWDGDGHADLAFGGIGEEVGPVVDIGGVVVLYGTDAGLQADSPDDQFWTQDSPGVLDQGEQYDGFAWSLTGTTS